MIFKILSDDNCLLDIIHIVRQYVKTPKEATFAGELRTFINYYIQRNLSKPTQHDPRKIELPEL